MAYTVRKIVGFLLLASTIGLVSLQSIIHLFTAA